MVGAAAVGREIVPVIGAVARTTASVTPVAYIVPVTGEEFDVAVNWTDSVQVACDATILPVQLSLPLTTEKLAELEKLTTGEFEVVVDV